MNHQTRTASCSCQSLNIECAGEPVSVSLCNCLDCQRRTGSAFGIAAFFNQDRVSVDGATSRFSTTSEQGYDFTFYFCPNCGSTVYWETSGKPGYLVVATGAFADPDFPAPTQSVFEDYQHPWLKFTL